MAQRNSSYPRIVGDTYVTPRWVYDALYAVEPWARDAWDCAPAGAQFDFLDLGYPFSRQTIATNPPFSKAEAFCRRAIAIADRVAMLLPYAFDAAKGRLDLWQPPFKVRYNIVRRIRWDNLEQKAAGPSNNHAWFVWDKDYEGPPTIGWL